MRLTALLTCLALAVTACGGGQDAPDDTAVIVASPWPLAWLAAQVAPDARLAGLGQAGQDPHELDLRPAERELLEQADAILYVGQLGFQPQVEDAVAGRPDAGVAVADAAADLLLRPHEDAHGGAHDEADQEAEVAADPHVWFDPRTLAAAAPALAERLAAADPARATAYARRAAAVARELGVLHREIDVLLSGCRHRGVVVGHEAFAYLLEPRGLEQIGISGVGGHGEASPARMAELTSLVRERGIRAVLTEPVEGREAAEALAREAGVTLRVVDTLESPDPAARERGYPDLLREQAATFADALECGT